MNYAHRIRELMGQKPRTKAEMVKYLAEHFRYDTMNSWNASRSYAQCVKVGRHPLFAGLTHAQLGVCYDMVGLDEAFLAVHEVLADFATVHLDEYQIGFNGRSSGYLVLYRGGRKPTGYLSWCTACGQRNYTRVLELKADTPSNILRRAIYANNALWTAETYAGEPGIKKLGLTAERVQAIHLEVKHDIAVHGRVTLNSVCGVCSKPRRVNYTEVHTAAYRTAASMGGRDAVEAMDIHQLRCETQLVREFDEACHRAVARFIEFSLDNRVVERQVMVPQTVLVAVPAGAEDAAG